MGQRGAKASFMPSKYVFPGGALDPEDLALAARFGPAAADHATLKRHSPADVAAALPLAAIRETFEETGVVIGQPDAGAGALAAETSGSWAEFFNAGLLPATQSLSFIFRAVTPPARTRRFDARFFLGFTDVAHGDVDDLSGASGELAHLRWLTLSDARQLDLPFITEVVLAEVEARLAAPGVARPVPYFRHEDGKSFLDPLE